jgi:hypothetical protein
VGVGTYHGHRRAFLLRVRRPPIGVAVVFRLEPA